MLPGCGHADIHSMHVIMLVYLVYMAWVCNVWAEVCVHAYCPSESFFLDFAQMSSNEFLNITMFIAHYTVTSIITREAVKMIAHSHSMYILMFCSTTQAILNFIHLWEH